MHDPAFLACSMRALACSARCRNVHPPVWANLAELGQLLVLSLATQRGGRKAVAVHAVMPASVLSAAALVVVQGC